MQCKIKKVTRYNVEGFDITLNLSLEELERLRMVFRVTFGALDCPEIETILNSINKELYESS